MPERIASLFGVAAGVLAVSVGLLMSRRRMRLATRVHRRSTVIHAGFPEEWGGWFFQGFSDLGIATRWLVAAGILVFWTALGLGLLSFGIRLAW